jgi:hypothetical protein
MSSQSPVAKMKMRAKLLFPALNIVASCDGDAEAATEKKNGKIGDRR